MRQARRRLVDYGGVDDENRAVIAAAKERIAQSRQISASLEAHALATYADGFVEQAIAIAAGAARFGYSRPTGLFVNAGLERMLLEIGRRHVTGVDRAPRRDEREHVLHVFTETYLMGGHTRLARRWIDLDPSRCHSVLVTGNEEGVPPWLDAAVTASGGAVQEHGRATPALARALSLRKAAARCDVVVLHTHPYDPIPLLAFADPADRPPVVVMNHADHVNWLGVGVADVIADFRDAGRAVSIERRGVSPERITMLDLPLPPQPAPGDRHEARRALGLDPERPLIATIASGYKFTAVLRPSFHDLAVEILRAVPDAQLVAVGPEMDADFARARELTGGRVFATGVHSDIAPLLHAADVYLNGTPLGGGTSLLEAGAAGLPIVSFVPDRSSLLTLDIASLDGALVRCATPQEYVDATVALLRDPAERARIGALTADRVAHHHAGAGWTEQLEALMATARTVDPAPDPVDREPGDVTDWEAILDAVHVAGEIGMTPEAALFVEGADPMAWVGRFGGQASAPAAPPARRALAAPRLDAAAVDAVVDRFRALRQAGDAAEFVVAVAPETLAEAFPLLEAALARGEDVDIDVVQRAGLDGVLRSGDLCLAVPESAEERLACRVGAEVMFLAA
jgi:glycosyltransferase involved in cell wall biosynthesis